MNPNAFTQAESSSGVWMKIEAHLDARLTSAQLKLERALSEAETNVLRGQIKELRSLKALANDPMPVIE